MDRKPRDRRKKKRRQHILPKAKPISAEGLSTVPKDRPKSDTSRPRERLDVEPTSPAALFLNNIPRCIFSPHSYWNELMPSRSLPACLCLAIFPNNLWSLWPILTKFDRGTDGSKTLSTCKSSTDRQPGTGEGLHECPTEGKAT